MSSSWYLVDVGLAVHEYLPYSVGALVGAQVPKEVPQYCSMFMSTLRVSQRNIWFPST